MERTTIRAKCLVNEAFPVSTVFTPVTSSPSIQPKELSFENGYITAIRDLTSADECDEPGLVVPGFIDLQFNGIDADDLWQVVRSDDHQAWRRIESKLLDQGVTAWCPTFISAPSSHYEQLATFITTMSTDSTSDSRDNADCSEPRPAMLGLHLEGPFLGSALGAHRPDAIRPPDWQMLQSFAGHIALLTIGAESSSADEFCRVARGHGVVVALGHTTPSREQYESIRDAGATLITHLFNAMSGMHHRHPGLAAWALADEDLYCSLIADGVHVDPTLIRIAFRSRPDHMVLVTDRVAHLHPHLRSQDGAAYRTDGTLAGSMVTMSDALRVCVNSAGVALPQALMAATAHPARVLGCTDRGQIAIGSRADLVALNDDLSVRAVWRAGHKVR